MSFYDSSTQQKGLQPLVYVQRGRKLLNANSGAPSLIFEHNANCPRLRVNFVIHNSHTDKVLVTLRHLWITDTTPGTVESQFLKKEIEAGGMMYLGLNKVMAAADKIVGWAGMASVVTVHFDYEAQH